MLLSAAVYYGKEGMIADTMHFVGFPVLWNVFVFFAFFIFDFPGYLNAALAGLFAVLHFVPVKYPYPSRATRLRLLSLLVSGAGMLSALWIIWHYPREYPLWNAVAIAAALYFFSLALWETFGGRAGQV